MSHNLPDNVTDADIDKHFGEPDCSEMLANLQQLGDDFLAHCTAFFIKKKLEMGVNFYGSLLDDFCDELQDVKADELTIIRDELPDATLWPDEPEKLCDREHTKLMAALNPVIKNSLDIVLDASRPVPTNPMTIAFLNSLAFGEKE